MKKILTTSLLGLTGLLALASCGNSNDDITNGGSGSSGTPSSTQTQTPSSTQTQTQQGYQVSVQYEDGTGVENVRLQFCDVNTCYGVFVTTDKNGIANQTNEMILGLTTDLIIHVNKGLPSGYTYDMNRTVVNKSNTSGVLTLHPLASTEHVAGTKDEPVVLSTLGYYKTCLTKDSVTFISFTPIEEGTYEVETYDDILSSTDTAINVAAVGETSIYDDNSGEGKNAKATFTGKAGVTYTIGILQQGTSTEEDFTFSILKK